MKKIFLFILITLFIGCGGGGAEDFSSSHETNTSTVISDGNTTSEPADTNSSTETNTTSEPAETNSSNETNTTGVQNTDSVELAYLNALRENAGMIRFSQNDALTLAAKNHAHYLYVNNTTGHQEEEGKPGFTGEWPSDRAVYAGFLSKSVSENVSVGQKDVNDSIDGLFSAIYHRFGFLTPSNDLIGIGVEEKDYVYDMGNSNLNELCSHQNSADGYYYINICADDDIIIDVDDYKAARDNIRKQNPDIIIWPYNNAKDIPPVFYNETPDPLPDYDVSGYPVSIQFNPYYFSDDNVTLRSFKLYDVNGNEISNTRFFDKNSDPNGEFDEYEFALFPLERLEWNTTYNAKVTYIYKGSEYEKSWKFTTRAVPYPLYRITTADETVYVDSGKTYAFYFVPSDGSDVIHSYSYSYPSGDTVSMDMIDYNTVWIRVEGNSGDEFNFEFGNGDKLKLIIN